MIIVKLDADKIKNKESMHDYMKTLFDLPDYFGKTLDSLYDVLTEVEEG